MWRLVITKTYKDMTYGSIRSRGEKQIAYIHFHHQIAKEIVLTFLKQINYKPDNVQNQNTKLHIFHSPIRSRRNNTIR